ncbi:unnamed protein product [Dovyalis caffra]|uniref:Small auxin up regulated protein n=1 Tax=Dovyalis caffra TaxID=77055 RepID=A0AAV1SMS6_9ROSI|nr:unnamed protein product [Dovyalis caffra]
MINIKKLIKLARKWQKLAAIKRRRITLPRPIGRTDTSSCSTSSTAEKGHFVVYSADQKRFPLPLDYLNHEIVRELLIIAEEEFGLPSNGPLTLPCDSDLMEYVFSLINSHVTRDVEKALLISFSLVYNTAAIHSKMISAKKLIKLAKKWQKLAAIRRRRITLPQAIESVDSNSCRTSAAVEKGHFVVYSADQKCFVLPLEYLNCHSATQTGRRRVWIVAQSTSHIAM